MILGWQMQKVAVGWEIYERTGSALHLGYAGLVQFFPQVIWSLIAGHVVDTYDRKRVFMAALACNALAAVGLALNSAGGGSIYPLYACLFLYGSARAFIMPSRAAFLPGIVPMEIFSTAVSWSSTGFEVSSMAGPALGGLLIGFFESATLVYTLNAAGQFAFIALLATVSDTEFHRFWTNSNPKRPLMQRCPCATVTSMGDVTFTMRLSCV